MGRPPAPINLTKAQRHSLVALEERFSLAGKRRWADRCRAVRLRADGYGIEEIARILNRPYRSVQDWCRLWRNEGLRGMQPQTHTRGRKRELDEHQRMLLSKVIDRGPRKAGYEGGVWTSAMLADYIDERWGVQYHPGHVRKLLHELGYSLQQPRQRLALGDPAAQERWRKRSLPRLKKTPRRAERS